MATWSYNVAWAGERVRLQEELTTLRITLRIGHQGFMGTCANSPGSSVVLWVYVPSYPGQDGALRAQQPKTRFWSATELLQLYKLEVSP